MSSVPFDLNRIGEGLAFADVLGDLRRAVGPGARVVVQAPPGTGKTTLVPAAVAEAVSGRVLVTQPRRVAARAAARRLAQLDGVALGERVGFSVRGQRVLGASARVEFVTPGLLLRRLLADPELEGVGAVVLDEVHERQLDTDLLLALLGDVSELREELACVVMSATLDAERYAALLGTPEAPAAVVSAEAVAHPLEVQWAPAGFPRLDHRGVSRAFLDHVAGTAAQAHARAVVKDPGLDALVFLPGVREVDHVVAAVAASAPRAEVVPLHGRVPAAEQDRVLRGRSGGGQPRIVVATGVAESSLTVPGVRLVVDSGLTREPRVDRARGMSGLVTVAASRATAAQRAGRATRLGPGVVVRCYDQATHEGAPQHLTPEIAVADLSAAMLMLAAWGTPGGVGLRWLDPPPSVAVREASALLVDLGAVDEDGRITATGRLLAPIPLDPRWASALVASSGEFGATLSAEVVAAASGDHRPRGADLRALLTALRDGRHPGHRTWRRDVERLRRLVPDRGDSRTRPALLDDVLGVTVARAWPDRVARRVSGTTYQLARGTRASLPSESALVGEPWLAVADVDRSESRAGAGTGAVIRTATTLDAAWVSSHPRLEERVTARFVDGRIRGRRVVALGAIELSSTPIRLSAEEGAPAVADALRREGLDLLTVSPAAAALRRRLAFLHRELGAPWPPVDDATLLERWAVWLAPEVRRLAEGATAAQVDLLEPLQRLLPWPEAAELATLAPERLRVPSGREVAVSYPAVGADDPPVVEVKLQECFGMATSPLLAGVPVLFHLLSPAGRPLAVTADLASFWSGPYAQVRAEMRGRYPKHPWPDDPWSEPATRRTKPRR